MRRELERRHLSWQGGLGCRRMYGWRLPAFARGKAAKSVMLVGLRGVGKTVLLDRLRMDAEAAGVFTVRAETPERKSLPALLAPQLRSVLLRLSHVARAKDLAARGLQALAGLAKSLKVKYNDIEVGVDLQAVAGLADNGDLEGDLTVVLEQVGQAAREAGTAVVLFLDELQYLEEDQFSALIAALHRCAQQQLPVTVVGAGLPQLLALAGNAKSYAERLFDFPMIGQLAPADARLALNKPAEDEGVSFEPEAVEEILALTRNYPYFLQEWGKHSWDVARESPITRVDVEMATASAGGGAGRKLFSRALRSDDAEGEELPAGNGRAGAGAAPIGRHRDDAREGGEHGGPDPPESDCEGHDLESQPWRHRVHRAAV